MPLPSSPDTLVKTLNGRHSGTSQRPGVAIAEAMSKQRVFYNCIHFAEVRRVPAAEIGITLTTAYCLDQESPRLSLRLSSAQIQF